MRVVRHLAHLQRRLEGVVLTLGNFDGVHLGHQAILAAVVQRARASGGRAVVLTFEPHPLAVLAPERAPPTIQRLRDRLALLRELGVDVAVLQRFTPTFAALEPEAFVRDFVLGHLAVTDAVVGDDVTFGRNRAGTADTLRALGARFGFEVERVGPVEVDGERVSSTRLRALLRSGDVRGARRLLGRPYALRGRVVVGDRRGRTLGFPTANLHFPRDLLLPADGVYAVTAQVDGTMRDGVMNVGVRPTFGGLRHTVEVHLLDFAGDLYRRWLPLNVVERLRGEQTFDGPDALRAAIAADVSHAQRVLAAEAGRG
jgi:riboflavin kinase/FMN adenylyltransferase